MELKQFLKLMKQKMWWIVTIVMVITTGIGGYSIYFMKPVYEASAKVILVGAKAETEVKELDYSTMMANSLLLDTYRNIVMTPRMMKIASNAHPELNATPEQLLGTVKVNAMGNQILLISVRDYSYERAAGIVNAVSKVIEEEIPKVMDMDNVAILDQAPVLSSPTPVKPNHVINVIIGFVVSSVFAVAFVLLQNYLDDRIRTEEEIESVLGVLAIAVIPKVKKNDVYPMVKAITTNKAGEKSYVAINQ